MTHGLLVKSYGRFTEFFTRNKAFPKKLKQRIFSVRVFLVSLSPTHSQNLDENTNDQ
jgi:hypothetical protein